MLFILRRVAGIMGRSYVLGVEMERNQAQGLLFVAIDVSYSHPLPLRLATVRSMQFALRPLSRTRIPIARGDPGKRDSRRNRPICLNGAARLRCGAIWSFHVLRRSREFGNSPVFLYASLVTSPPRRPLLSNFQKLRKYLGHSGDEVNRGRS